MSLQNLYMFLAPSPYEEKLCILRGKIARSSRLVEKMHSFLVVDYVVYAVTTVPYRANRVSETST